MKILQVKGRSCCSCYLNSTLAHQNEKKSKLIWRFFLNILSIPFCLSLCHCILLMCPFFYDMPTQHPLTLNTSIQFVPAFQPTDTRARCYTRFCVWQNQVLAHPENENGIGQEESIAASHYHLNGPDIHYLTDFPPFGKISS